MQENKFYSLVSDTTFKYLFQNEETRPFFEELIKYYTGLDVSNFEFLSNELSSGNNYVSYRVDNLLSNEDKNIILNVEMNNEYKDYTDIRNRRYLHTIAGKSEDNKYEKRVVIQLNFNNYLSKEDKNICSNTYLLTDNENNLVIEDFKIHNIYIPKEEELCYNEDIKRKLKLFLCKSYEEMRSVTDDEKELLVIGEIEKLNKDKYFGGLYNAEEEQKKLENSARYYGKLEGIEEGIKEGIKEGINQGIIETAKKMKKDGLEIEKIIQYTNLTKEEIEKL